jgi:pimeloyl-ACP methyl ester carboxylesterase
MADPAPATTVRERPLSVDGIRSRVLETGPEGAAEAVVYVHGNPNSADEWRGLMKRTGEFARSVAVDLPGFGKADRPGSEFKVPVEGPASFLGGAFDQLGVTRAHLVLHDFGGPWGLAWAATHPDAFASVVLINTGVLKGFEMHRVGRLWARPVVGELVMALTSRRQFTKAMREANPKLPAREIDAMYDDYDRGTRKLVLRLYRNRTNDELLDAAAAHFAGLDRPALVVWGGSDPFVPLHHAEQQKQAFPRAEVVVLEGSSHWPFLDDPEGVAAAVLPFLRAQVAAAGAPSPPPG